MVAWRLSNTLEADFCTESMTEAPEQGRPEVFNTYQGSQFTSQEFTWVLHGRGVKISMDGRWPVPRQHLRGSAADGEA